MYSVAAFSLAQLIVELPYLLVQAIVYSSIVYWCVLCCAQAAVVRRSKHTPRTLRARLPRPPLPPQDGVVCGGRRQVLLVCAAVPVDTHLLHVSAWWAWWGRPRPRARAAALCLRARHAGLPPLGAQVVWRHVRLPHPRGRAGQRLLLFLLWLLVRASGSATPPLRTQQLPATPLAPSAAAQEPALWLPHPRASDPWVVGVVLLHQPSRLVHLRPHHHPVGAAPGVLQVGAATGCCTAGKPAAALPNPPTRRLGSFHDEYITSFTGQVQTIPQFLEDYFGFKTYMEGERE